MQLFLITGRFVVGSARTLGIPVGKKEVAMSATKSPPAELTALLTALDKVEPNALSSCPGWTCHHIAAHICGNYEEIEQHVVAFEESRPLERTRTWEEREQPLGESTIRLCSSGSRTARPRRLLSLAACSMNSLRPS